MIAICRVNAGDHRQRNDESIQVGIGVWAVDSAGVLPATEASQEFRGHLPRDDQWHVGGRELANQFHRAARFICFRGVLDDTATLSLANTANLSRRICVWQRRLNLRPLSG